MARATYTLVHDALGQTDPPPWDETKITALLPRADNVIDAYTAGRGTISATSDTAKEIAVDVVLELMSLADKKQTSTGTVSHDGRSYSESDALTPGIKQRIDAVLSDESTSTSWGTVTQIDTG